MTNDKVLMLKSIWYDNEVIGEDEFAICLTKANPNDKNVPNEQGYGVYCYGEVSHMDGEDFVQHVFNKDYDALDLKSYIYHEYEEEAHAHPDYTAVLHIYYDDSIKDDTELLKTLELFTKEMMPYASLSYDPNIVKNDIKHRDEAVLRADWKWTDAVWKPIEKGYTVMFQTNTPPDYFDMSGTPGYAYDAYSGIVHLYEENANRELQKALAEGYDARIEEVHNHKLLMCENIPEPVDYGFEDDGEQLDGQDFGD
jgi:hypothetical protein